jgi:hypothetical protein
VKVGGSLFGSSTRQKLENLPIRKIAKAKNKWSMVQMVECLLGKCKALSLNSSTTNKK